MGSNENIRGMLLEAELTYRTIFQFHQRKQAGIHVTSQLMCQLA